MNKLFMIIILLLTVGCLDQTTPKKSVSGQKDSPSGLETTVESIDEENEDIGYSQYSDEFEAQQLDPSWQLFNTEQIEINQNSGSLNLNLIGRSHWYNHEEGPLLYKNISGDFSMTARIRVRMGSNFNLPPVGNVELGGIILRDSQAETNSYVFLVTGFDVNDISVETKSTENDISTYVGPSWNEAIIGGIPFPDVELRICRLGNEIRFYKRPIGSLNWIQAENPLTNSPQALIRQFPDELQAGLVLYSNKMQPDVQMQVDYVRFNQVNQVDDCTLN